jgi:hypothetical protein
MFTDEQILEWLNDFKASYLKTHVNLICQIANAYREAIPQYAADKGLMESAIDKMVTLLREMHFAGTAEGVRTAMISACDETFGLEETPKNVTSLNPATMVFLPPPVPSVPKSPPAPPRNYTKEIEHLRSLRSQQSDVYGLMLAKAAEKLQGCFHWVGSGPRPMKGVPTKYANRITGLPYGPKMKWSVKKADYGSGWEEHEEKQNDFARWIAKQGTVPDSKSYMNCWESVFFSAYMD